MLENEDRHHVDSEVKLSTIRLFSLGDGPAYSSEESKKDAKLSFDFALVVFVCGSGPWKPGFRIYSE